MSERRKRTRLPRPREWLSGRRVSPSPDVDVSVREPKSPCISPIVTPHLSTRRVLSSIRSRKLQFLHSHRRVPLPSPQNSWLHLLHRGSVINFLCLLHEFNRTSMNNQRKKRVLSRDTDLVYPESQLPRYDLSSERSVLICRNFSLVGVLVILVCPTRSLSGAPLSLWSSDCCFPTKEY